MKIETYFKLHFEVLVMFFLIGTIFLISCGGGNTPGSNGEKTPGSVEENLTPQTPPQEPLPDLVISTIEVFPEQPKAGIHFAINVYVKNAGQLPSGEYDLKIYIIDVSRQETYPVGTFRKEAMQPGEKYVVYSSTDRLVNNPGAYQVHVEITPFLFKDGDDQNNTSIWAFTVK